MIPGLTSIALSCDVGCRRGLDTALLWLWRRPVATAPIGLLAWEPPYAVGVAQEMAKKKKEKKKKKEILKALYLKSGTRQECRLSHVSKHYTESPSYIIKPERKKI